jgi:hypothetical protein
LGFKSVFSFLAKIFNRKTGTSVPEKNVMTWSRHFSPALSGEPHLAGAAGSFDHVAGRGICSNPRYDTKPLPIGQA